MWTRQQQGCSPCLPRPVPPQKTQHPALPFPFAPDPFPASSPGDTHWLNQELSDKPGPAGAAPLPRGCPPPWRHCSKDRARSCRPRLLLGLTGAARISDLCRETYGDIRQKPGIPGAQPLAAALPRASAKEKVSKGRWLGAVPGLAVLEEGAKHNPLWPLAGFWFCSRFAAQCHQATGDYGRSRSFLRKNRIKIWKHQISARV